MSKDVPILDLVRAAAACWVMLAHLTLIGGRPVFLLSQGSLGVEVFIFISGFLMTLILKDEAHVTWGGLRRFYVRRFFRIMPAFWVCLPPLRSGSRGRRAWKWRGRVAVREWPAAAQVPNPVSVRFLSDGSRSPAAVQR